VLSERFCERCAIGHNDAKKFHYSFNFDLIEAPVCEAAGAPRNVRFDVLIRAPIGPPAATIFVRFGGA
jgi:hypothetical protein